MPRDARELLPSALWQSVNSGADGHAVAEELVKGWVQIEERLAPILGRRGLAVLFRRTLQIAGAQVSWIASAEQVSTGELNIAALAAACAGQPPSSIAQGGAIFLQSFYDLLSSLIGVTLTAQLLFPVGDTLTTPANQDSKP